MNNMSTGDGKEDTHTLKKEKTQGLNTLKENLFRKKIRFYK